MRRRAEPSAEVGRGGGRCAGSCSAGADAATSSAGGGGAARGEGQGGCRGSGPAAEGCPLREGGRRPCRVVGGGSVVWCRGSPEWGCTVPPRLERLRREGNGLTGWCRLAPSPGRPPVSGWGLSEKATGGLVPGGQVGPFVDVSGEPMEGVSYFSEARLPPGVKGQASFQGSLDAC